MRSRWGVMASVGAALWSQADVVQAAAAAQFFGDIPMIANGFVALLYLVAVAVVVGLGINAASDLGRGRMSEGSFGIFATVVAAVLLFVLVPQVTAAGLALGATIR